MGGEGRVPKWFGTRHPLKKHSWGEAVFFFRGDVGVTIAMDF